ncbi:bifunctional 2-polyprenyl-6-hydroxyphenol methylase/3-demethylubiquinol 3-O-methyltransferase UbiG [Candidatus Erwinia haradaeae]|uniref:Ubiquinone biosynthesis O-methyltransferase n=1 Tax=Candidatus Erwinia haradaeae TaxID=1922217 RepID=A0A451D9J3_9GAMM|nr:bifunctional 2-polyprenyl-6-hydroxyphenol methylase/3-demethylubiquinol 3-O-methyltransferase UbiG [Candidatus Erwinia haradaeae]VFP82916.1 Ubiquinone biosynthesis O-methyltransferase [Candidatus Erwinia haradaeae]
MKKEHIEGAYNVDHDEIDKFSALSSCWWNLEGQLKPLHSINAIRLGWIGRCTNGLFNKNILDVGCGGGILSESMAEEGAHVTGLDMSAELLHVARTHAQKNNMRINYIQQTVEDHVAQCAGQYEVITCMELLEHVIDPHSIICACSALIKPGGDVFFSTINRTGKSWLVAIIGAEYVLNILPRGTHSFEKFIRPSELLHWVDQTSLYAHHIIGLEYMPLRRSFQLTFDVDVNYMVHTRLHIK